MDEAVTLHYDPEATLPGECDLESCFGCTDWYACNYILRRNMMMGHVNMSRVRDVQTHGHAITA